MSVDGTIAHTPTSEPCEYCVVLEVRNDRGEPMARQVVGVGVLQSGEMRRLNVSVEMLPVRAQSAAKAQAPPKPLAPARPGAATVVQSPAARAHRQRSPLAHNNPPIGRGTPANASMQRLGVIRKPR